MLIILGVLLLTFLLFRVAAGDPARTVLGKNPSPKEVEALRMTLSSGKPLIWGHWRQTEIYTSAEFAEKRKFKGIAIGNTCAFDTGSLKLNDGTLIFSRNFDEDNIQTQLTIRCKGPLTIVATYEKDNTQELKKISSLSWKTHQIEIATIKGNMPKQILISAPDNNGRIENIDFQRRQGSPWDSQLFASLKEIVWFKSSFPYISFFNFGRTLITREPVKHVLQRGVGPSLALMVPIFIGELLLGILFALLSAAYRDKWPDKTIMLISIAGMSISYIVFMIFGQWYLSYHYNIFPVWGFGTIKHLVLPVMIGIISGLGGGVRFYRTIFVNELKKEYLRTAEAKGCSIFKVYCKHLLRNAAVPLITRASTILPFLFTGSLLLESFFGIPGLGYAGVNALMNSDLQMVKALVILTAILFVAINLLADISYAWADPRARCE